MHNTSAPNQPHGLVVLRSALLFPALLLACGARTPLETLSTVAPEGGVLTDSSSEGSAPPDADAGSPRCRSLSATPSPVRVSDSDGHIVLLDALPIASGVLVGFSNAEVPTSDPSWRVRSISYDGTALGPSKVVFQRNQQAPGWTRISLASGFGHTAATAWDGTQEGLFVPLNASGSPLGVPVHLPGDTARDLLATSSGYTVLRNPFQTNSPVALAILDLAGQVTGTRELVPATEAVQSVSRRRFDDGSFALNWSVSGPCQQCHTVYVRHFTETGEALAPVAARQFTSITPVDYNLAPSSLGLLAAWFEREFTQSFLVTAPLDRNGASAGDTSNLAEVSGPNFGSIGVATAPGGDVIVSWTELLDSYKARLLVQLVTPEGTAQSPPLVLTQEASSKSQRILPVVSDQGIVVLYQNDVPSVGAQVFAIPLRCNP